jgi:hypothetical protein
LHPLLLLLLLFPLPSFSFFSFFPLPTPCPLFDLFFLFFDPLWGSVYEVFADLSFPEAFFL